MFLPPASRSSQSHLLSGHRLPRRLATTIGITLLAISAGPGRVQEPAPQAPAAVATTAEAQAFLGYWELSAKIGEREVKMGLVLSTDRENGDPDALAGQLVSFFGEMTAERFRKNGDKLGFDLTSNLGKFLVEIEVDDDEITGVFGDEGGSLTAAFTGAKSDRLAFQRFMAPDDEARIQKGDQLIRVRFARPKVDSVDFAQIESLRAGQVVQFLEFGAIKMMTDLDLQFGDLEIEAENVAPDYPGVYSLWLKRTDSGWSLAFNKKPDVWGTQYDPAADIGEVPLTLSAAPEASARLVAGLEENADGATLSLTWGAHRWQTPFRIVASEAAP